MACALLGACTPAPSPTGPAPITLTVPALDAQTPTDYPGLHNVVAYAPDVLSGAMPEGDAGFESLRALGIRTVISVDGAPPDLVRAEAAGLRYVHLPIGYDGMSRERALHIARAVRDLPKPVYVHCHHGKHRSACAAGTATVLLGLSDPGRARSRMLISGTSPSYPGLYRAVEAAEAASTLQLDGAPAEFPARWVTSSLVQAMVEIDGGMDNLRQIRASGWSTPPDHPDLVPPAEAGRIADALRILALGGDRPELTAGLERASALAARLEARLQASPAGRDGLDPVWSALGQACTDCHKAHRD